MGKLRWERKVSNAYPNLHDCISLMQLERVELCPGDYVTISASRYPFANVMQPGRRSEDWVNSISRTLNWNSRQRQKSFKEWHNDAEVAKANTKV